MEVKKSMNRFLSIFLIVALGVSFFSGLQSAAPDMRVTEDTYFDDANLMDIRVISTMGLSEDDAAAIAAVEGVAAVEGTYMEDVYTGDESSQSVLHVEAFPETMNQVALSAGSLPTQAGECFLDQSFADAKGYEVGDVLEIAVEDEDDSTLAYRELTITGIGYSPCYIANDRGSTTLGTGTLSGFVYVTADAFDTDVYSVIYVQVEGAKEELAYTDAYEDLVEEVLERIEAIEDVRCEARYVQIQEEAQSEIEEARVEIEDGEQELADAKQELADAKAEAESELAEAESELLAAESELADGKAELEDSKETVAEAQSELADGEAELAENEETIAEARSELRDAYYSLKTNEAEYASGLAEYESESEEAMEQLESAQEEIDSGAEQIASGWEQYNDGLAQITSGETQIAEAEEQLAEGQAAYEQGVAELAEKQSTYESSAAEVEAGWEALEAAKTELAKQQSTYDEGRAQLDAAWESYSAGAEELASAQSAYDSAAAQAEELRAGCESAAAAAQNAQSAYDTAAAQVDALSSEIEALNSEIASLEAQIAAGGAGVVSAQSSDSAQDGDSTQGSDTAQDDVPAPSSDTAQDGDTTQDGDSAQDGDTTQDGDAAQDGDTTQDNDSTQDSDSGQSDDSTQSGDSTSEADTSALKEQLAQAQASLAQKQAELAAAQAQVSSLPQTIAEALSTAETLQTQLTAAESALAAQKPALDEAAATLAATKEQLDSQETEMTAAKAALDAASAQLEEQEAALTAAEAQLAEAKTQLEEGQATLDETAAQLAAAEEELAAQKQTLETSKATLASTKTQLESSEAELAAAQQEVDDGYAALEEARGQLLEARAELDDGWAQYYSSVYEYKYGLKQLEEGRQEIVDARAELEDALEQIADAEKEIAENEQKIADGWDDYYEGKAEAEQEIADAEQEIADAEEEIAEAEQKIADAEEELADLAYPEWYVYDRSCLPENTGYGENADRMTNIAQVFPVIFFLVAALISLTTMTRMVEEERTQIGTLKALGYGKWDIAKKYLKYAFWATACGSIFGILFGEKVFPWVIIKAYQIMYKYQPAILVPYNWVYGLAASGIALACTLGATLSACYRALGTVPAELMRPPAPKQGKRVFLEHIPLIWKHLNFNWKSTVRNLMRYKRRQLMTIFGIGGCMGLLMVGYGLRDSIGDVGVLQYSELQTYDAMLVYDTDAQEEELEKLNDAVTSDSRIMRWKRFYMQSMDIAGQDASGTGKQWSIYVYVPENTDELEEFLTFRSRTSEETYTLTDEGAIITEKIAKEFGLSVGDSIRVSRDDGSTVDIPITAICENYLYHYIYLTPTLYEELFGEAPEYNSIFFCTDYDGTQESLDELEEVGKGLLSFDAAVNITYMESLQETIDTMLSALDLVIIVLIVSAGLLAFVVQYNLNNININERRRELATLKVLGFYDGEVSAYIFRENAVTTVIGAGAGVFIGKALHAFIITTVEVDSCMFGRAIYLKSYMISILFTIGFSIIVNFVMHFRLKKIDMVESLKSIE
ncbi:MAG: FtsX-like permease family protein [Lachnospiraceae bacterium]|nr:FtsX-like permease family protein [Lachnospiraceae bacterium]